MHSWLLSDSFIASVDISYGHVAMFRSIQFVIFMISSLDEVSVLVSTVEDSFIIAVS